MYYKKSILFLFILIGSVIFSQNIQLPVKLDNDLTGLQLIKIGNINKYKINITYDLTEFKKNKNAVMQPSFILPVPSSAQYQNIEIINANFMIKDMARDVYGNTVLITEITDISKKTKLSVVLDVECLPSKFSIPKNFIFDLKINETFLNSLNNDFDKKSDLMIEEKISENPDFNEILNFIKKYKDIINSSKDRMDKIYDPQIIDVYPIEKQKYFITALELLNILSAKKIYSRLNIGYNIPEKSNKLFKDFLIEIYVPNKGFLILNKELELFLNKGYFISCYYQNPVNAQFDNFLYLGVVSNNEITFIKGKNFITAEILTEAKTDEGYDKNFITNKNNNLENAGLNDFIINNSSIKNKKNFIIININDKDFGRIYSLKPESAYSKNIILSPEIKDKKPLMPGIEFNVNSKVYAFVELIISEKNKKNKIIWLKPGGDIYKETNLDIPGNWGYYYTYIAPNSTGFEKGVWAIELIIDDKLEMRKHFIIK